MCFHRTHDLQNVLGKVGQDLQINISVTFTKSAPRPIQFMLSVPSGGARYQEKSRLMVKEQ